MRPWLNLVFVAIAAAGGYLWAANDVDKNQYDHFAKIVAGASFVDLSHRLEVGMPDGPGPDAATIDALLTHAVDDGGAARIHLYSFPGQWGTHIDAPIHFVANKRTLEDIPVSEMILPLVVLDIHQQVLANPDYQVSMDDVAAWEQENGEIPAKSFVALRSDWSKRWPSLDQMRGWDEDGISHSPAWSMEVLEFLSDERNVTAIGHETMDTDTGKLAAAGQYPLETYFLGLDKYQIENMTSLDQVPPSGAFIVASWMNSENGAGFPARVFAIIPRRN